MENDISCDAISGSSGTNCAEVAVSVGTTTNYVEQESVFNNYILATSTTAGSYTEANYAEFDAVAPAGDSTITIIATKNIVCAGGNQLTDGAGVAGIQLVQ